MARIGRNKVFSLMEGKNVKHNATVKYKQRRTQKKYLQIAFID